MTTIVTTQSGNYATLVADQGITSDLIHPPMPKVVRSNSWLIAYAGDINRNAGILQHCIKYPKPPATILDKDLETWDKWFITKVIPLIAHNLEADNSDWEAILVTHGKAFHLNNLLGVSSAHPYWAIGTGASLAIGALASTCDNPDWYKNHDIHAVNAINTAIMHDPNSRGPINRYYSYATGDVGTEYGLQ